MHDHSINFENGWVNINTDSPNRSFFYKLQFPVELNKSAFGCKVAFFSVKEELIYYNSKCFAHELHTKEDVEFNRAAVQSEKYELIKPRESMEFVKWSVEGNMAFISEYNFYDKSIESVFIHLKELYCYRICEEENDFDIISRIRPIDQKYSEEEALGIMDSLDYIKQPLVTDEIKHNGIFKFFGKKWYPKIKT